MINDIHDLLREVGSSVLIFPCNDVDIPTGQISLADFHWFIMEHSNYDSVEATAICSLVRLWVASKRSYYIDQDSLIRFRLGGVLADD